MKHLICLLVVAVSMYASPPTALAIRNARIVMVSGPVIEEGTVLVRDGLIEAVGADVAIPPEAWIVEGEKLTVYPGLIDALSTAGMPSDAPTPAPAPQSPRTRIRGPEDRPSCTSWLRAADQFNPSDRRIEQLRSLGFTTAVVYPTRGIFAGQGAVINLAGEKGAMVVAAPSAQYLTFTAGGFLNFPGSLMGVMAYMRQLYLDAAHYRAERDRYNARPAGAKRPNYDRALEGVIESPRILLPASRAVELDRMTRFSRDLKQPTVLYGGTEAYAAAAMLREAGMPLLVSLKWPERPKEADPDDVDPARILEVRERAPSSPAELAKAGARFALYTDGQNGKDLARAIKRALDAGLQPLDAVKAFTLAPAEIYGVADRLGSIDKGKIANLVVTEGELFAEKTKIKYIIVDGAKYEPAPETSEEAAR
jgi:imidazolonepropionase-like amidohydrolase